MEFCIAFAVNRVNALSLIVFKGGKSGGEKKQREADYGHMLVIVSDCECDSCLIQIQVPLSNFSPMSQSGACSRCLWSSSLIIRC